MEKDFVRKTFYSGLVYGIALTLVSIILLTTISVALYLL